MKGQRSIRRRVRHHADGLDVAVDINAEIAINSGAPGGTSVSRSAQSAAITQTSKTKDIDEQREKR